jgi:CheY-like chemotaxis protein
MIPTVLAVDDDRQVLAFVARVLHPNCHVIVADDPMKAITLAENVSRLDLVIADYNMPGMTGDEVIVRIRQVWPHVEVLYLTGYAAAVLTDQRASQVCLVKPVTAHQLREVVAMLLGRSPGESGT